MLLAAGMRPMLVVKRSARAKSNNPLQPAKVPNLVVSTIRTGFRTIRQHHQQETEEASFPTVRSLLIPPKPANPDRVLTEPNLDP